MLTAIALASSALVAGVATPVIRSLAHGRGLLDEPGGRKVHETAVPRLGGVAMLIGFAAAIGAVLVASGLIAEADLDLEMLLPIAAGMAVMAGVGLIDDLRGLTARIKLAAQLVAALVAVGLGLTVDRLALPGGSVELGLLAVPITVAWIVGVINAINMIDGLDGLASGVVLTVLAGFGILAAGAGEGTLGVIIAATAGAVIGFAPYNLYPATIIMGDTGAMSLGFVLAGLAVGLTQAPAAAVAPWVPMLALGVPLADLTWAVLRRLARGGSLFRADARHLHHQLLRAGLGHRAAMLALTLVSAMLVAVALAISGAA